MKIPVEGLKAILLQDMTDGSFFLRFPYSNKDGFIDAEIRHNDLEVTLRGEGVLVVKEETAYVDHSDEVLGN